MNFKFYFLIFYRIKLKKLSACLFLAQNLIIIAIRKLKRKTLNPGCKNIYYKKVFQAIREEIN